MPAAESGAGSSVVLVQMWEHDGDGWESLPVHAQENVMGRTKPDSTELDDDTKPADRHGVRDALTRYTQPLTGAYYTVPSTDALARFAPPDED